MMSPQPLDVTPLPSDSHFFIHAHFDFPSFSVVYCCVCSRIVPICLHFLQFMRKFWCLYAYFRVWGLAEWLDRLGFCVSEEGGLS